MHVVGYTYFSCSYVRTYIVYTSLHIGHLGTVNNVCLCGVTAKVALVHSILEHQTCGSVVGVGDQVVSEPLSSSLSCVVK